MVMKLSAERIIDPVQTNLAQGYTNEELIGLEVFPAVPAPKEAGKIVQFGKEAFKRYNSKRAIRADSARIDYGIATISFSCDEYSLESAIDDRERDEATSPVSPETDSRQIVQDAILLELECQVSDAVTTAANWASGHSETLAGTGQWSHASSDPVAAIKAAKEVVRSKIGRYPNYLGLSPTGFTALTEHDLIIERIKYSQSAVITEQLLAAILGIPKVRVGKAVTANAAGVFSDVWNDCAFLGWVPPNASLKVPALGYTLRRNGYPKVEMYRDFKASSDVVCVKDNFVASMTSNIAGYLWKDVTA